MKSGRKNRGLRATVILGALAAFFVTSGSPVARVVPQASSAETVFASSKRAMPGTLTGTWDVTRRGFTVVSRDGARSPVFFPDHARARFKNGLVRLKTRVGRRMDMTLVVRGKVSNGLVNGVGIRIRGNRISIVSIKANKLRRIDTERVRIAKRRSIEIVALVYGNRLVVQVHKGRGGKHLKSLSAKIASRSGRTGILLGKRHRSRHAIKRFSARRACVGGASAKRGPVRYVGLTPADEARLTAPMKQRLGFLERTRKKGIKQAIYKTDTLGIERMMCSGVNPKTISLETPWKYVDESYRRYRHAGVIRTKTGFRVDASYKNPKMVKALLKAYAKRFPDLTDLRLVGRSRQNRPIYALAIGTDVKTKRNKPTIFLNGAHHGNEALSVEFIFDAIQMLLEQRHKPQVKRWLDNLVIWCVPMVNPDGSYAFLEVTRRTGRKNGRDNDGNGRRDRLDGVDLNRNYPFRWHTLGEKGSHSRKTGSWYRGPKPASEPETQAMMALANSEVFAAALTYHVGTVALLAPYTIDNVQNPSPNEAWVVAEEIVAKLPPHPDRRDWVVRRNLYSVDGTDQDWHRAKHGTLALLIEGARTSPINPNHRRNIVKQSRGLYTVLLDRYLDGPTVHGYIRDKAGKPVVAQVQIAEVKTFHKERWMSRCRDGHYDRFLAKNGDYTLVVTVDGHPPIRQPFKVQGKRVQLDITLPFTVKARVCPALPQG